MDNTAVGEAAIAINRFEDIESWQEARVLASEIYRVSRVGDFDRDWGLKDQIRRASISIVSNIAEGFERQTPRDFCRFLRIAKGSAGEVRAQLYIALDAGLLPQAEFDLLYDRVSRVSRLLSGFIRYLERHNSNPMTS